MTREQIERCCQLLYGFNPNVRASAADTGSKVVLRVEALPGRQSRYKHRYFINPDGSFTKDR